MPERPAVAIVGANGFVGSRAVELLHLSGGYRIRPVVRSVTSLPRLSRFDLDWRLAEATNAASLAEALKGCDAVIYTVAGDPKVIEAAARALMPAANAAGVGRVVYLSTASVHGQNIAPGTTEDSPLSDRQPVDYNNAKVRAERILLRDRRNGACELVMLRPCIVFGPRDSWVTALASELRRGCAWLVEEGRGVCNTIYVDNLVEAARLAMHAPASKVDGKPFFVGDADDVTWGLLYRSVAERLNLRFESVHQIPIPQFPGRSTRDKLEGIRISRAVQSMAPLVPWKVKMAIKGAIGGFTGVAIGSPEPAPVAPAGTPPAPHPNFVMTELQRCGCRLSWLRAREAFGYQPLVGFTEGIGRTLAWLDWCEHIREAG